MLPTEIPPDTSCSSKNLTVKTDEVSEKLVFQEADPLVLEEIPNTNFCIRDYVVASRSKDIKANWPFMLKTLQLYVKHGIKDLLPPFEPPDLVRAQSPLVCSVTEQSLRADDVLKERNNDSFSRHVAIVRKDSCSSPEDLVLDCSDQGNNISSEEQRSTIDQGTSSDKKHLPLSSNLVDNEPGHKARLSEALENKCRLVVKLGGISETNRAADIVSNSKTGSEPMVSKVCPVCNTFSSTSNTILNAHIDQCLSTESVTDKVFKFPKHEVKPRKKRLMVDIYTTAPSCTLEDLDRRNGTNWAMELALQLPPNTEVVPDTKRPKLSQIEPTDEGSEGAVYVDSNGIKLRILSKLKVTPSLNDSSKLQKHTEEMNSNKSILTMKRKHLSPKYTKNLKLKGHKKPKNSFKLLKAKMPTTCEEDYGEESHQQIVESQSQLFVAPNHVKKSLSSSTHPRASEYSDAPPKQANEVSCFAMERVVSRKKMRGNSGRLDPINLHSIRKHKEKLSSPSEDFIESPKTKRVDSLDNATVNTMIHGKIKNQKTPLLSARWSSGNSESIDGLLLRQSKASRKCSSSDTYSKDVVSMNDDSLDVAEKLNDQNKLKSKGLVKSPYFHFNENKGEAATETLAVLKKIRRHRSKLRTAKRGFEVWPSVNGGVPRTFKDLDPESDKPLGSCQSSFSENINQDLPNSNNDVQDSEVHEDYDVVQIAGHDKSIEYPPETAGCNGHDGISDVGDCPKLSREIYVCEDIGNDNQNAEKMKRTASKQFNPSSCIEETECSLSISDHQLKGSAGQEFLHGGVYSNEIGNRVSEREDEYQHIEVKDSSFNSPDDCHPDSTSAQDSGGCLTSHRDSGLNLPHKSSSITSICLTVNHDTNLRGEKELSGSPVSTASMTSSSSPRGAKSNDSKIEMLSSLVVPAESKEEIDRSFCGKNGDVNWNLPVDDQIMNDKPCCCSCGESLSRDSQLSRQSATARTLQAKQVPSLFIGPRISSSFSAYQSRRTNPMTNTNIGSSNPISSVNNWSNADMPSVAYTISRSPNVSSQSQNQPTSIPVLRLMGKNLLVVNNEELVQTQSDTLDQPANLNTSSPAFGSTNNHFKQELLPCHHQFLSESPSSSAQAISDHPMPMQFPITTVGGFAASPYNSSWIKTDYQSQHERQYTRLNSLPTSCAMNEVIIIDDSPERETELGGCLVSPTNSLRLSASDFNHMPQRSFSYFPSQSHSRKIPGVALTPMFQNVYPGISAGLANHGNIQEGQVPCLTNPLGFRFPMTGQLGSSMYYPQTLPRCER